jgi:hypothetical protein
MIRSIALNDQINRIKWSDQSNERCNQLIVFLFCLFCFRERKARGVGVALSKCLRQALQSGRLMCGVVASASLLQQWVTWNKNFCIAHISMSGMLTALGLHIQMCRGLPWRGSNLDCRRANPPFWPPGHIPASTLVYIDLLVLYNLSQYAIVQAYVSESGIAGNTN